MTKLGLLRNTFAVAFSVCCLAQPSVASPMLDQQNELLSSSLNGGSDVYGWQQGITAGLTGQLTQIAVFVDQYAGTTELTVYLGAPWHDGPAAWSIAAALDRGWNTFDVTAANIFVISGNRFAIGIHGQGQNFFPPDLGFSYGDLYAGGELYLNGSTAESVGNDLNFRTFVDPDRSAIPEPGSFLLLGAGIAAVAATRRRHSARTKTRDMLHKYGHDYDGLERATKVLAT